MSSREGFISNNKITKKFSFRTGFILSENRIMFNAVHDDAEKKEIEVGMLFVLKDKKDWVHQGVLGDTIGVAAVESPQRTVFLLRKEGEVLVWDTSGKEEKIESKLGNMRSIRAINSIPFVVGMGYQVYYRNKNKWINLDKGFPKKVERGRIIGFNAITGTGPKDLTAVGWSGEIWHYNGKMWQLEESPVDIALFDVQQINKNEIYACGQLGTILYKIKGKWKMIGYKAKEKPGEFRSMAWFKGCLYLTDGYSLYSLNSTSLDEVKGMKNIPCGHLHTNGEWLLSVAPKDVYITRDGKDYIKLV